jgi:hypothetical protein
VDQKKVEELLRDLGAPSPSVRKRAILGLVDLCATTQDAPFDKVLAALRYYGRDLSNEAKEQGVQRAIFHARFEVGRARARVLGLRIRRGEEAGLTDDELVRHVIDFMQDSVNFYGSRETLRSVLDFATPGLEALHAIWWTRSEINNGGFEQYFFNSTGILSPEALRGYRRIGATDFALIHQRATERFEGGVVPDDVEVRREALDRIPHGVFRDLDEEFVLRDEGGEIMKICAAYVRAHPEEFFLD